MADKHWPPIKSHSFERVQLDMTLMKLFQEADEDDQLLILHLAERMDLRNLTAELKARGLEPLPLEDEQ